MAGSSIQFTFERSVEGGTGVGSGSGSGCTPAATCSTMTILAILPQETVILTFLACVSWVFASYDRIRFLSPLPDVALSLAQSIGDPVLSSARYAVQSELLLTRTNISPALADNVGYSADTSSVTSTSDFVHENASKEQKAVTTAATLNILLKITIPIQPIKGPGRKTGPFEMILYC